MSFLVCGDPHTEDKGVTCRRELTCWELIIGCSPCLYYQTTVGFVLFCCYCSLLLLLLPTCHMLISLPTMVLSLVGWAWECWLCQMTLESVYTNILLGFLLVRYLVYITLHGTNDLSNLEYAFRNLHVISLFFLKNRSCGTKALWSFYLEKKKHNSRTRSWILKRRLGQEDSTLTDGLKLFLVL